MRAVKEEASGQSDVWQLARWSRSHRKLASTVLHMYHVYIHCRLIACGSAGNLNSASAKAQQHAECHDILQPKYGSTAIQCRPRNVAALEVCKEPCAPLRNRKVHASAVQLTAEFELSPAGVVWLQFCLIMHGIHACTSEQPLMSQLGTTATQCCWAATSMMSE